VLHVRDIQTIGGDELENMKRYAVYVDVLIRGTLVIDAPCEEDARMRATDILDDVDETNARKVFDDHSFDVEVKNMEEVEMDADEGYVL
jgi:hypothetical protein